MEETTDIVLVRELAEKEVKVWLDFKRISEAKRIATAGNIERIINAIMDGRLSLDPETKVFKMKLQFPIGKNNAVSELKFKPRLTVDDTQSRLADVVDGVGRAKAYMSAATGEDMNVLGLMDTEDYHLSGDLVIFFMIPG